MNIQLSSTNHLNAHLQSVKVGKDRGRINRQHHWIVLHLTLFSLKYSNLY